jgi:hypothetical protein
MLSHTHGHIQESRTRAPLVLRALLVERRHRIRLEIRRQRRNILLAPRLLAEPLPAWRRERVVRRPLPRATRGARLGRLRVAARRRARVA